MSCLSVCRYIELVRNLQPKQFLRDCHLPELLVFARGTDLHEHKLYKSGAIILQDKVSMSHLQRNLMKCVCRYY